MDQMYLYSTYLGFIINVAYFLQVVALKSVWSLEKFEKQEKNVFRIHRKNNADLQTSGVDPYPSGRIRNY